MTSSGRPLEVWFVTGSQEMYGAAILEQVAAQSLEVATALSQSSRAEPAIVWKPVLTNAEAIRRVCLDATADDSVVGIIAWMHTFSPAKAWIAGLNALGKPLLHLHTQANRALPWADIDMNFMNLNQSAHGDREFGYLQSRMGIARKTIAGHVADPEVVGRVNDWLRATTGWQNAQTMRMARFGDNMRDVAVTDGDKVGAQIALGISVNSYSVDSLTTVVNSCSDDAVERADRRIRRHLSRCFGAPSGWRRTCITSICGSDRTGPALVSA